MSTSISISSTVPCDLAERLSWLPTNALSMGINCVGGKGVGKSKWLARCLLWQNLVQGVPTVLWDCVGGCIDQLLTKVTEFPKEVQVKLWPRLTYVNMAGAYGQVVPFPIVYRLPDEPLAAVADRYVDAIRRTDAALAGASIEGLNALSRVAIPTIMLLAALDEPITSAISLLDDPQEWEREGRFEQAVSRYPEAVPAAAFFQEYLSWSEQTRARNTLSLRAKLATFTYNPSVRALYGGNAQYRLDWDQVVRERRVVLLDFRHIYAQDERRFALMWSLLGLLDWVRHRGPGHHHDTHPPLSIVIDELAAMLNVDPSAADLMAADVDSLLNVLARNYNLRPCVAYQAPSQFDPKIQRALFGCGTQIVGAVSNIDDALILARNLFTLDVHKVKRYEPVYSSYQGVSEVIDHRAVDYTVEEQQLVQAYRIKNQLPFHFLARIARREGDTTAPIRGISIANFDPGRYANEELAEQARTILSKRSGVRITDVLAEMQARQKLLLDPKDPASATMNGYAHNHLNQPNTRYVSDQEEDVLREEKQL